MAEENKEIVIVDDKTIQEKIYLIRGQRVMPVSYTHLDVYKRQIIKI